VFTTVFIKPAFNAPLLIYQVTLLTYYSDAFRRSSALHSYNLCVEVTNKFQIQNVEANFMMV